MEYNAITDCDASASENLKDIINNIDMEFAKRSNERIQATVLMQTVRLKVNQIGLEAPPVPVAPFIQSELGYKGAKRKRTYRKNAPCDTICADAAIHWARVGLERVRNGPSVGGSFAARWARMVLKRCSSERGEREKRF